MVAQENELHVRGRIEGITIGLDWDGSNTMRIKGYDIVFNYPVGISDAPVKPRGTLIGFGEFGTTESGELADEFIGESAEAYFAVEYAKDEHGERLPDSRPTFTIFGKSEYFIRLVSHE